MNAFRIGNTVCHTTNNGVVTEGRSLADILIEIQKLQLS